MKRAPIENKTLSDVVNAYAEYYQLHPYLQKIYSFFQDDDDKNAQKNQNDEKALAPEKNDNLQLEQAEDKKEEKAESKPELSVEGIEQLDATAAGASAGGSSSGGFTMPPVLSFGSDADVDSTARDLEYNALETETPSVFIPPILEVENGIIASSEENIDDEEDNNSGDDDPVFLDAFDNAKYGFSQTPLSLVSDFSEGLSGWTEVGHGHTNIVVDAAFLSTFNGQHKTKGKDDVASDPEEPIVTKTLSANLNLSVTAFNVKSEDASEGSAIWRDISLAPGQRISFDFIFGTNEEGKNINEDYAFVSLAGQGNEVVFDFFDSFNSNLSETNTSYDSNTWKFTSDWLNRFFDIPSDWTAGTYRLGFGIIDVSSPNNTINDSSFVVIDNVMLSDAPTSVPGNVILDPNEDLFSADPISSVDQLLIDGGKVTEISFEVQGNASDYINDYDLNDVSAVADGSTVRIPVPSNGDSVVFLTPAGGILEFDKDGNYSYTFPSQTEVGKEEFHYTLSSIDESQQDIANLTIYLSQELEPENISEDSKQFEISLGESISNYHIFNLDAEDIISFYDVVDSNNDTVIDFEDAFHSWVQEGANVIARLENDAILVLDNIGTVPVAIAGLGTNAELDAYLQNTLNVSLEYS